MTEKKDSKKAMSFSPSIVAAMVFIVAVILWSVWSDANGNGPVPKGYVPKPFALRSMSNEQVTSEGLKGKVVVLDFWATWCPPCREEMPFLVKLAKEFEPRGAAFVFVNLDNNEAWPEAVRAFAAKNVQGLEKYVYDGNSVNVDSDFHVKSLPTLVVIGKNGQVVKSIEGSISERRLREWVEGALLR